MAGKEEHQLKYETGFAAWKNVSGSKVWERAGVKKVTISTKESVGYYKWKQHKPWFDE